jgi:hypothetical protein
MVTATLVDPLDIACHTQFMLDAYPKSEAVKPQQEVRFTVCDPLLDEALIGLERYGENHHDFLPHKLYVVATKRITVDDHNKLLFQQYRKSVEDTVGNSGYREFHLLPWLKPLYAGGPGGKLAGVGLRAVLSPLNSDVILAPPFLGIKFRPGMTTEETEEMNLANAVLEAARNAKFLPVRYEISNTVDDPNRAITRLERVLTFGTTVTRLRVVPAYPSSARLRDLYPSEKPIARTLDLVTKRFYPEELPVDEPDSVIATEAIESLTTDQDAELGFVS